ncbi:LOW QUALITY PROTEIN: lysosomal amino acid transporter 1 homolog [Acridotheres tristis]
MTESNNPDRFGLEGIIVIAAFYVNKDLSMFVYCKLKNQKVAKGSPSLRNLGTVWIRRCTEGTFYLLLALAMMGNCTCGLSLAVKMPNPKFSQLLCFVLHLPWLLGSFGVLFLDILYHFPVTAKDSE